MAKRFVCKTADLPAGRSRTFKVGTLSVLVLNDGGAFRAFRNFCPHMGGALRFDGTDVVCGWHGARFDAADGTARKNAPAEGSKLETLPTSVDGDGVFVDDARPKSPWAADF